MAEERPPPRIDEPLPEGEERPPPGTRSMAIARWVIVAIMAAAAAGAWIHHGATQGARAHAERFGCPMHPSIVAEAPGECPICGMDLVAIRAGARHAGPHAADAGLYTCPLHPEVTAADPEARCPRCGGKVVPSDRGGPADMGGVPGLAPVELSAERIQLGGVRTAVAAREPLAPTVRTVGFVMAPEAGLVSVTLRYSGWVESLAVGETGRLVQKGEILATVYSPELLPAQQVFLNAFRWGSPAPAAAAQAGPGELERARQRLELLGLAPRDVDAIARGGQATLSVNVRSPVRGYVARRSALKGLFVQPGTELFQIADLSTVSVLADVYEGDLGRVRVGQRAVVELAAYPGRRFAGQVRLVYPALDPGTRTLQARIELENPALELRPGMYGDVTLELGREEAVVVPRDAVVDTGELRYVFLAQGGGRYVPRRVRTGWAGDGKVAILEGVREGDEVVTAAGFLLDSESRLRAAVDGGGAR